MSFRSSSTVAVGKLRPAGRLRPVRFRDQRKQDGQKFSASEENTNVTMYRPALPKRKGKQSQAIKILEPLY
jgi:hypothetical protein